MPVPFALPGRRPLSWLAVLVALLMPAALAQQGQRPDGPEALAAWVEQLRSGVGAEGTPLGHEEEVELLRRIVAEPREAWWAWVERLAATGPGSSDRFLAVRLLGAGGDGGDLGHLATLASAEEEGGLLTRAFSSCFEAAVTELLRRDPSACTDLRRTALEAPEAVRRSLATALAGVGGARALQELVALLGYDPALDPTLLAYVARTARDLPGPCDPDVARQVRRCIASDQPQVIACAAEALGGLEDIESVEVLVEHLDHPETCVRGSAHRALKAIAGVQLPAQRTRWEVWLAEERTWYEEHATVAVEHLGSRNRMTLVQALAEIGTHRLHRHEMALEVVPLLERSKAEERALACVTLAQLGSAAAVPYLTVALDDEDAQVRASAWGALKRITGQDLPADATAWAAWMGGGSSS
jgi:HEAT repeat protein